LKNSENKKKNLDFSEIFKKVSKKKKKKILREKKKKKKLIIKKNVLDLRVKM